MATITQQLVMQGMYDEDKRLQRDVAAAVASLSANIDLIVNYAAHLFNELGKQNSYIDREYVDSVVSRFNEQGLNLDALMQKVNDIRALDDPDPVVIAQNLATFIAKYNCTPDTFANRYKP